MTQTSATNGAATRVGARLEVRDLDFHYGTVQVLFSVSMDIEAGEMLALLGTNGAGKSSLLRAVSGLRSPSGGQILLDGADVAGVGVIAMVRNGVCLLEGGRAVFPDLTVSENLDVGAYSIRRNENEAAARREHVLDLFPRLKDRLRVAAGSLSGGEQQQLALAKAFLLSPKLLCIDEMSLGLAPIVVETLLSAVRSINAAGTTVVLVEQSLDVAAQLCPRAVFMEKGEVRFEGRTSELLDRSDIARAVFLGDRS